MKRLAFFIAFMTLGTFGLIQLLVREPGPAAPEGVGPSQVSNVLAMNGVQVHQIVGDQIRWELQAAVGTYDEDTNTGHLEDVRFHVFEAQPGSAPQVAYSGRSVRAYLAQRPGSVVLQGAVVLNSAAGMEIRSERLEYDAAAQLISSPGRVWVRTDQGIQEGAAMRYFLGDDRLEFVNPIFYQ